MRKEIRILFCLLLLLSNKLWGQVVPEFGEDAEGEYTIHRSDRTVNFGVKGGFTSSLFLVSDFVLNGTEIKEVENNYKIGYFGSVFMRLNFGQHFLQPEISYAINRCDITFNKPLPEEVEENTIAEKASITSSIHSIEVPVIYGYNIIKEERCSFALFAGPKIRYILDKPSRITFENFDQQNITETLYPFNFSVTAGVAVTISRVFFDFRYDIGLHNISKRMSYQPVLEDDSGEELELSHQIRFHRRDNVLSFSLGVFF